MLAVLMQAQHPNCTSSSRNVDSYTSRSAGGAPCRDVAGGDARAEEPRRGGGGGNGEYHRQQQSSAGARGGGGASWPAAIALSAAVALSVAEAVAVAVAVAVGFPTGMPPCDMVIWSHCCYCTMCALQPLPTATGQCARYSYY